MKGRFRGESQRIPKLLHYIYLTGLEAYQADAVKPDAKLTKKHFEGCQNLHQHWDSLFWDEEMGFELVKKHYAWFVPVWESYEGWGKQVAFSIHVSKYHIRLHCTLGNMASGSAEVKQVLS